MIDDLLAVYEPRVRAGTPKDGFNLPFARLFAEALEISVIVVGGFHTKDARGDAIISGCADAVSVARALIADPCLYRAVTTADLEDPVCGYCNGCIARFTGSRIDGYSNDIRARREVMLSIVRGRVRREDWEADLARQW
ncbi:hypothetical protein ACWFRF_02735 [Nocardia sp. NPDC055165]